MLANKGKKTLFPKQFLWRLTLLNIIIVSSFIVLSSWAIYHTACFLVDGMGSMNNGSQKPFHSTLFNYLLIFSFITIVVSSLVHFYLTKKLIHPLKELIESTKSMKQGHYPKPIETTSEDEIGELIGHFNGLAQQLINTQENREKLISDLSHEFRTPLSNLEGYLNALKSGVVEGNPRLYESLLEESKRLTKMIEQLDSLKEWNDLSLHSSIKKEDVDINVLITQAIKMFDWLLIDRGIATDIQIEHATIHAHYEGILQVISNLLDNAIYYYQGTEPITITGVKDQDVYIVSIAGPGQEIPLEHQNSIFERFYRIDPSRNRETGGTGLGLAITKEIIEQHHGKIDLNSEHNYHVFNFSLPIRLVH
ncbi:MAG TPA: ATP-binding protein [Candidatus Dormibacteraeota bacterium]|nr:ATP-binding protein [Candidatus Dormibacteraeota bacterium]